MLDEKLVRARTRLFELEAGGKKARPIDVSTAALVEPRARSARCPRCDEPFDVVAHEARSEGVERLREAKLVCRFCKVERSLWFRVVARS